MAKRKRLLWRLYITYLVVILLSVGAISWYTFTALGSFYLGNQRNDLADHSKMVAMLIRDGYDLKSRPEQIDPLCKQIGHETDTRITVVLLDGRVLGDSWYSPHEMDDHIDRPEIQEALEKGIGHATRYSYTTRKNMMYVASVIKSKDGQVAVARVSKPEPVITQPLKAFFMEILAAAAVVAMFAAVLSFLMARWIHKPLQIMKEGADRFAKGDLSYRLNVPELEETAFLADALNQMAAQMDERIRTITRQRNELEAALTSMVEAVFVLDDKRKIIRFNRAAGSLFEMNPAEAIGKNIEEISRKTDLNYFIRELYKNKKSAESEILFRNGKERHLQVYGTFIKAVEGEKSNLMVVLNDITKLKRLERVRRDFVANVSHELKTPITSIMGFVETLKDGAINDPENALKFLEIITRHSDRLNAIIDDLLALSKIEQGDTDAIRLEMGKISSVIDSAVMVCHNKAVHEKIKINVEGDPEIKLMMDRALIEQAMINLIDNAIKYSSEESEIKVVYGILDEDLRIDVIDQGCGIEPAHLPRLFERFYRVDKARSRKLGGTGLGLAIVKHIVSAHSGTVKVDSRVDQGSTFSIRIPV